MGEGFLRASYRERERKGVGQLDNSALIRNICRFCGGGRKAASGGREVTASCFICLSGQVSTSRAINVCFFHLRDFLKKYWHTVEPDKVTLLKNVSFFNRRTQLPHYQ